MKKFLLKTGAHGNVFYRHGGSRAPSRDVLFPGLAGIICHRATDRSIHLREHAYLWGGVGLTSGVGSMSGTNSSGAGVALAAGVGVGIGDKKMPLFVINFPSREITSSTRYKFPPRVVPSLDSTDPEWR
jgi:hypothetical protein